MATPAPSILIAGGDRDPNMRALAAAMEVRRTPFRFVRVGAAHHPWITWDLDGDQLVIDGEPMRPRAAFLRHDVFTHLSDQRPESSFRALAWHTALSGWIAVHEDVRVPNRDALHRATSKPQALHLAREAGLAIPKTLVTNHVHELAGRQRWIVKPVGGGGYCQRLIDVLEHAPTRGAAMAAPGIVQPELVQPEVRVFGVGGQLLAFSVASEDLDYRVRQSARLTFLDEVPQGLGGPLARLMARMGLDFAAADFKTCPDTGRLLFLEINTSPMFAAFDQAAGGAVTAAIAAFLEAAE